MDKPLEPARRNLTGAVVPALAAAALAGLATLFIVGRNGGEALAPPEGCITGQLDQVGGPLDLVDVNGRRVTQADFASGSTVVYFGFTHCPDICPTALYDLGDALAAPNGVDVQTVFVTLDPERDTPNVMDIYSSSDGFPPGLVGLTGTPAQVSAAASAFRVNYRRAPVEGSDVDYNVDHSSFFYVMDGQWRTRAMISSIGQPGEVIAACIAAGLASES